MPRMQPLDPDHAPSVARTLLADIIDRNGDAGPMVRTNVALNQLTGAFNLVAGLEPAVLADAGAQAT